MLDTWEYATSLGCSHASRKYYFSASSMVKEGVRRKNKRDTNISTERLALVS